EALERLLGDASQRQRIAGVLEPLYEAQGAYAELARILEVQLEDLSDPSSQVGLLLRIAELAEVKNHDMDKALTAISRAVTLEPSDTRAREELARLATIQGAEPARARVLAEAADGAEDTYLVSELLMELARLYDEHLGDLASAEKAYTRLIEVDGDNPDAVLPASQALERIHLGDQKFELLAEDLRRQVPLVDSPDAKRGLLIRLADLFEDTLENTHGAIAAHRERLDNDPNDVDAMLALERLYERGEQWQRLIGVLQSRDNATEDDAEQQVIGLRIGEIYEEKLDDSDNAIVAFNEVLGRFGASRETLGALGRLYEKTEKWDDLLEVVEQELSEVEDVIERAGLRFRAGELMRRRTGDVERAIEAYSEVMAIVPDHEGALAALEAVVAGDDRQCRTAAARVLTPRYEGTADYEKLIAVLIVAGESDDPTERLASLRRAAEVADVGLESPSRAFELTGEAVKAGLGDPDLAGMLADLERHSVASERFADYVALLREIAADVYDGDISLEILLKIADSAVSRLEDDELAAEYYDKVLAESPQHADALDSLEALKLRQNDHRGLLEVLRRKTELAEDTPARVALLLRQAELSETSLEDVDAAIDAYEQVLNQEVRPAAFDGLERLYRRAERFDDLASALERRLDAIVGGAEGSAADVRYRLGRVCQLQLEDTFRAIECYREVLGTDVG
ncbi:MAG: tetratricopeptide repeat protein, partial [Deltaproteobacteria bacterium]|nr:tetratricopeptide repeat protein [Deltaproteobacteria bacterium]